MTKIEIGQISGIGRSLFVICLLAGAIITAATRYPAGIIAGAALGIYLLFAIKVVRQWEKVAVLRLGRYVGLRGPGLFHIVPIVETLSPYVDQRVRVANVSAEIDADPRHRSGQRGCHRVLAGLECGEVHSGGGELHRGHQHERPDGAARIDWPSRTGADDHRARDARP